ncbi:hypothetical protein KKF91_09710 [Myxococcota bacterium]|nr:hypothetical protein [Myxococcota bacterium]MBU1430818.1 hypothetical protein [Myxococcota bacterium]MBU1899656.1 hypothetical protein [Myxococcota bacterium]
MRSTLYALRPPPKVLLLCLFLTACGSPTGCEGEAPPFPNKDRVHSAIQVRISSQGFSFLTESVGGLIEQQLPEGLSVCVPGAGDTVRILGFDIVTWGYCQAPSCAGGAPGCPINISLLGVELTPIEPNRIKATATFDQIDARFDIFADGLIECALSIHAEAFPVEADLILSTPDPLRDFTFRVEQPRFNIADLNPDLEGDGGISELCDAIGGLINLPWLGDLILDLIQSSVEPMIADTLATVIEDFTCMTCVNNRDCPVEGGGRCEGGRCVTQAGCVPKPLGVEGAINLGDVLGQFSPGLDAEIQYLATPGSYVQVEQQGLSMGVIAGFTSARDRCAPDRPQPTTQEPARADLLRGNLGPNGQPFEAAFGVTRLALEHAAWAAFNSGALCLSLTADQVEMLNTRTLGIALPELQSVTRGPAPLAVTLSPQQVPQITIGANQTAPDPDNEGQVVLIDPLITLTIPELWIDFHAFMEQRWVRIFSLKADVVLPLGVDFTPDNRLIPLLGDLAGALSNLETHNGELLLDDLSRLEGLLPVLIAPLANMASSGLIEPIAIPELMGFQLNLQDGGVTGIEEGRLLAVFAAFDRAAAKADEGGAPSPAETAVKVTQIHTPSTATFASGKGAWRAPFAEVEVSSDAEDAEFSWRIKGEMWRPFTRARSFIVRSPLFLLQGRHTLEVRARRVGDYRSLDPTPATAEIIIDSQAPELTLAARGARIEVAAHDWITPEPELEIQLDDGPWARLGGQDLDLEGVGVVRARATDEAGQRSEAEIIVEREQALIGRPSPEDRRAAEAGDAGGMCSQARPGAPAPLWLLLLIVALPLRRRWAFFFAAALTLALGCSDEVAGTDKTDASPAADVGPGADVVDLRCKSDADCPNGVCRSVEGVMTCVLLTCEDDPSLCQGMSCAHGGEASCQGGVCQCEPFCPEGCPGTQYCCYLRNTCENPAPDCALARCEPGFDVSVEVPGGMSPVTCQREGDQCGCVEKAPLNAKRIGRYSDMAIYQGRAYVSAYAEDYGDLVVGRVNGEQIDWMWVDGVPSDGEIIAGPSGPRGGISAVGPDVGRMTAIATGPEGQIHVAYYDVTAGDLKYALGIERLGGLTWSVMTLDADGDAGTWPSIAVNGEGLAGVAYRAQSEQVTQLRYVQARAANPDNPSAWGAPVVLQERLIEDASTAYPEGTGLFTSQAVDPQGRVTLAWYDRTLGALFWARGDGLGFGPPEQLAGWGHPSREGDMGANVDITFDAEGNAHLCYQDGTIDGLRYLAPALGLDEIIDDGVRIGYGGREHALHVVGEDCNILIDEAGAPLVIYQDATAQDLLILRAVGPDSWERATIAGREASYEGAFGFYTRARRVEGALWISHYVYRNQAQPRQEGLEITTWRL